MASQRYLDCIRHVMPCLANNVKIQCSFGVCLRLLTDFFGTTMLVKELLGYGNIMLFYFAGFPLDACSDNCTQGNLGASGDDERDHRMECQVRAYPYCIMIEKIVICKPVAKVCTFHGDIRLGHGCHA